MRSNLLPKPTSELFTPPASDVVLRAVGKSKSDTLGNHHLVITLTKRIASRLRTVLRGIPVWGKWNMAVLKTRQEAALVLPCVFWHIKTCDSTVLMVLRIARAIPL